MQILIERDINGELCSIMTSRLVVGTMESSGYHQRDSKLGTYPLENFVGARPDSLSVSRISWTSISIMCAAVSPERKLEIGCFDPTVELEYAVAELRCAAPRCIGSTCVEMMV